jgi:poly(3-hydroxybutyrate) depolymerase
LGNGVTGGDGAVGRDGGNGQTVGENTGDSGSNQNSSSPPPGQQLDGAVDDQPSGDSGAGSVGGPAKKSSGCGKASPPPSGTYDMDVSGTQREYIVTLPDGYDANTPYKLIFAWHYLGGTAAGIAGQGSSGLGGFGAAAAYYGLKSRSNNTTIFVAGQGLGSGSNTGWPNTNGQDVAFAKAMWESLRSTYCVDEDRVFSVGMSYGGIMSNTVGCAMGDVLRAIAPMSGSGPGYGNFGPTCTGQVAAWLSHGNMDNVVSFSSGEASRDHWVQANHCSSMTTPTDPSPCVAYQGCDQGYPVTWCEFSGGHTIPSFAADAIWKFFAQF